MLPTFPLSYKAVSCILSLFSAHRSSPFFRAILAYSVAPYYSRGDVLAYLINAGSMLTPVVSVSCCSARSGSGMNTHCWRDPPFSRLSASCLRLLCGLDVLTLDHPLTSNLSSSRKRDPSAERSAPSPASGSAETYLASDCT